MKNPLNTTQSSTILYTGPELEAEGCDLEICTGISLDEVIAKFHETLCASGGTCLVKVSSTDECCNYLRAKFTSEDESITFTVNSTDDSNGNACETIDLSVASEKNVLYNNWTPVSSDIEADLISYTMPANTMATNGDEVTIDTSFFLTHDITIPRPAPIAQAKIYFGSVNVTGNATDPVPYVSLKEGENFGLAKIQITRISATSISYRWDCQTSNDDGMTVNQKGMIAINVTVPDLSSNAIIIKGYVLPDTDQTVYQDNLTVKIFRK